MSKPNKHLMVEAHYIPSANQIQLQFGPMITDPVKALMQVAAACTNAAQGKLDDERAGRKGNIAVAPAGMRIPRSD